MKFFNIGRYKEERDTFYEWKSKNFNKSISFIVHSTRSAPERDIFYTINKKDYKAVYYIPEDIDAVFTIGADPDIQSVILEALLEYLHNKFFEMYEGSLLTACYGERCDIFNGFTDVLLDSFRNFRELDLVKATRVNCKACKKNMQVYIKKSLIENASQFPVPIVFVHSGHALLIYIDRQYKTRGTGLVSLSYK
ncbi:MAG: hypothetical protein R6U96_13015 [Promethearchaeia archaeon]